MFSAASRADRIAEQCRWILDSDLHNWDDPDKFLRFVGIETVKVCTLSKGVRKERNGWSPETKGLTMNLRANVTMLRHVNGCRAHKNMRWNEFAFLPGLNAILRKWRQNARKISITGQERDAFLNLCRYGETYWHKLTWAKLVRSLPLAYKSVKAALHGAERTRRRTEINKRVAKIEDGVKRGQTGSAIRYALGPKNRGFDLSSLRIDEEEWSTRT